MIKSPRAIDKISQSILTRSQFKERQLIGQTVSKVPVDWQQAHPWLALELLNDLTTYGPVYAITSYGVPIAWAPKNRVWRTPYAKYPYPTNDHYYLVRGLILDLAARGLSTGI